MITDSPDDNEVDIVFYVDASTGEVLDPRLFQPCKDGEGELSEAEKDQVSQKLDESLPESAQ